MIKSDYIDCPNPDCDEEHDVDFWFSDPDDGDETTETVECTCGCKFSITASVEIDVSVREPTVLKMPRYVGDIPEDEPYHSYDPNQLSLL